MKKRVYNKTVGKIFRTLGFLILLAVSLVVGAELVIVSDLAFLDSVEPLANDLLSLLPVATYDYLGLALLVGLLLLVWAIRRGIILRVLLTVALVGTFALESYQMLSYLTGFVYLTPSWLGSGINAISDVLDQLLDISPWLMPGGALLVVMLLWAVFANKRPKRFSIFFMRVATITLFFGIVALALEMNLTATFVTATWFELIKYVCYIASYALIAVGSLFGVLGFYRK